jgi:hypothetical protein
MILREHRLVVERIDMADAAAHKKRNDRLGPGLEMRRFVKEGRVGHARGTDASMRRCRRGRNEAFGTEQLRQGDAADAAGCLKEEVTTRDKSLSAFAGTVTFRFVFHGFASLIDVEELVRIEDDVSELGQCRRSPWLRLLLQEIRRLAQFTGTGLPVERNPVDHLDLRRRIVAGLPRHAVGQMARL